VALNLNQCFQVEKAANFPFHPLAMTSATVRVPASTSNLGPGFDTLGLAVCLYNEVAVTRREGSGVRIVSPIVEKDRPGATEMITEAAKAFFRKARVKSFGFDISLTGDVPIARGLGSSVTARLGCAAALNVLAGSPMDRQGLLEVVTDLEGHPDNAAPATFGGFAVAGIVGKGVRCLSFKVSSEVKFVTLIPDFEISTPEARKLVPTTFSKADTIHNLNRAALISAAFASGNVEALRGCLDDRVHQPYRQQLIPELSRVIQAGERAGAIGGWLSGSGSTIMCVTIANLENVAKAMKRALPRGETRILTADNEGFQII
jgi:homoserine kinase